jgi:hypothetical protein
MNWRKQANLHSKEKHRSLNSQAGNAQFDHPDNYRTSKG